MPLFRKSTSDSGTLSEGYKKVLHRCRMLLVKDLDIPDILDYMSADDGFKPEIRDQVMSLPSREQRVGVFLDKLEHRGDRSFNLFLEAVKEHYKHVHYVLEESLRTIDDIQDSHQRDRAAITGNTVRKLLRTKMKHHSDQSHGSESADDLDMIICENTDEGYIDCYSIPMRGHLQKEPWIKHLAEPKAEDVEHVKEATYMASLVKDVHFKKIEYSHIPKGVKLPPKHCNVFVVDNDTDVPPQTVEIKPEMTEELNEYRDVMTREHQKHTGQNSHVTIEEETCNSLPDEAAPPVPPKPDHLPNLSSITVRPKSLRSHQSRSAEPEPIVQPPPRTTSKVLPVGEKPKPLPKPKPRIDGMSSSRSSDEDLSLTGPPLPPRGSPHDSPQLPVRMPEEKTKLPAPVPPQEPRGRSLSDVIEEASADTASASPDLVLASNTPQPSIETLINGISEQPSLSEIISKQSVGGEVNLDESQDSDHTLTYDREKVVGEPLQTPDPQYEAVTPKSQRPLETNLDDCNDVEEDDDDPLSRNIEVESGWDDEERRSDSVDFNSGSNHHSRETTPGVTDGELAEQAESSKLSGDSHSGSLTPGSIGEKSSTTDSGVDNVRMPSPTKSFKKEGRAHRPPMLLPRTLAEVQVLAENDSSDETSYYEDIDIVDKAPSPSGKSTMTYLDPKSYGKSLDNRDSSRFGFFDHAKHASMQRKSVKFVSWEITGKLNLNRNVLLIADTEEACDSDLAKLSPEKSSQAQASAEEPIIDDPLKTFLHTVLAFDKDGHAYYVPGNLLKKYGDPDGEPWYYPVAMSSRQATLFLNMEQQEGCYVIYQPTRKLPGVAYNLSLCRENGDVVHYHIIENIHGDVMIEGHDHSFMNIRDLVQYFRKNKSQLASRLRRPLKEARMPITPGYHYDIGFEINRNSLELTGKIIGRGNFGVVCAGVYQRIHVATKVLQKADASVMEEDDFIGEARVMMGLRHDHVVRLIGVSCTARPYYLVTEYVPRGSLRDCLREKIIPPDNIDTLFDICIQVTSAMQYLESLKYVLHRDIAARNFLVAEDMCVKLADFGRACHVIDDYYQAPKTEKIAIKWAAPEVLLDSVYSTKSDVWSLGVVYWEVFNFGERPYTSLSGEQTAIYVSEGGRLDKPPRCAPDLAAMMKSCWRDRPDERPSFAILYDKLKSKSSIYYAGPNRDKTKKRISSVDTTTKSTHSPLPPKLRSPHRPLTPTSKHKRNVIIDGRTEEYPKEVLHNIQEDEFGRHYVDRLNTSSSEASLVSAAGTIDSAKDDLTRGDKIRKSLRNLIKKPKRKGSKLEHGENGPRLPHYSQSDYQ